MNAEAADLWERAKKALVVARSTLSLDADAAAARAYYAAFYAVSANFSLKGKTFTKHSAVEAAVHRDMVGPGIWAVELGEAYSRLVRLRRTGDYGVGQHVGDSDATEAVEMAERIVRAVAAGNAEAFGGLAES